MSADENRRTYTYALRAGALPVANYRATVAVRGSGCRRHRRGVVQ